MKQYRVRNEVKYSIILMLIDFGSELSLDIAIDLALGITKKYSVDPNTYSDVDAYRLDAQIVAMVNKNGYLSKGHSKKTTAIEKFRQSEAVCTVTNNFFRQHHSLPKIGKNWDLLYRAQRIMHDLLGEKPKPLTFAYGPGASYSLKAGDATIVAKLQDIYECTPLCYDVLMSNFQYNIHLALSTGLLERTKGSLIRTSKKPQIVNQSRYTTVPKDALTDRSICIEPLGNMMCQKALGNQIRSRMCRYGIDLNVQHHYHERLARKGSLDGSVATIDLSSASDTIALELVRFLVPQGWFDLLKATRTPNVLIEDEVIRLEKISSMGNGYTWELESAIFYVLTKAVAQAHKKPNAIVTVFGDDIICDSELAPDLIDLLRFVGFATNNEKTFTSGPFRESCGADFYSGIDVRPIFIKQVDCNDRIEELYNLVNRIHEISCRLYLHDSSRCSDNPYCKNLLHRIPIALRAYGPVENGDRTLRGEPKFRTVDGVTQQRVRIAVPKRGSEVLPTGQAAELTYILAGYDSSGVVPRGAARISLVRYTPGWW